MESKLCLDGRLESIENRENLAGGKLMATARVPDVPARITFKEAMQLLSREERFMATVAAMNSLLIQKGVYTAEEFDALFCSWAIAQTEKPAEKRHGWR